MQDLTCPICATVFTPRARTQRFCGKQCSRQYYNSPDAKQCTEAGCDRPLRARQLCSTHWKRLYKAPEAKPIVACANCGQPTAKRIDPRFPFRFCSYICRSTYRANTSDFQRPSWVTVARRRREAGVIELHPHPMTRKALLRMQQLAAAKVRKPRKFFAGYCVTCRIPFVDTTTAQTCSVMCAAAKKRHDRREHDQIRQAREMNAFITRVNRFDIYERDKWKCQICGRKVAKTSVYPDLMSPSLDHIIPLSKGGSHEPANVRLSHFLCNAKRGNRGHTEQLALI